MSANIIAAGSIDPEEAEEAEKNIGDVMTANLDKAFDKDMEIGEGGLSSVRYVTLHPLLGNSTPNPLNPRPVHRIFPRGCCAEAATAVAGSDSPTDVSTGFPDKISAEAQCG